MNLGNIIKTYRTDNKLSQDEFASLTGLSKAYISILERNRNPVNNKPVVPSLETIKAVANAIGMDFNELIAILDGEQPVLLTPTTTGIKIPVLGRVAAGIPIDAIEDVLDKVKHTESGIMLIPNNPSFEPMFFFAEEIATKPVQIIGRVVEFRRTI